MIYEIKDTKDLVISLFCADSEEIQDEIQKQLDEIDNTNTALFWDMMAVLYNGVCDVITTGHSTIYTYTRSAQKAGYIQKTAWFIDANGDMIPLSHHDINYINKSDNNIIDCFNPGLYETITY